jgi:hypothetical protein
VSVLEGAALLTVEATEPAGTALAEAGVASVTVGSEVVVLELVSDEEMRDGLAASSFSSSFCLACLSSSRSSSIARTRAICA